MDARDMKIRLHRERSQQEDGCCGRCRSIKDDDGGLIRKPRRGLLRTIKHDKR